MADSKPGYSTLKTTQEEQIWASGPDNQHKRFDVKADIKSTVTDSGNSPTTTLRGGLIMGLKDSDGLAYKYSPTATDGTQKAVGIIAKTLSMLDPDGTAEDKFSRLLTQGILKSYADLINQDKMAMANLLRQGFTTAGIDPHGSSFLLHPKARYFQTGDYTIVDGDHGTMQIVATNAVNFTLPVLATVGPGFEVLLFNSANVNMVVTAAADTILYDDTANGLATTLTWSTSSQKMGASVLMRSDYNVSGTLVWYPLFITRTVVAA